MNPFFTKTDRIQQLHPRFSVYIGHPLTKTTEKLSAHQMHTGTPPANTLNRKSADVVKIAASVAFQLFFPEYTNCSPDNVFVLYTAL